MKAWWLAGLVAWAPAGAADWHSDPMGTYLMISFNHSNLVTVPLIDARVAGTAAVEGDDFSGVDFAADLGGLQSFHPRWVRDLQSDQFFNVGVTPGISFVSRRIVGRDGGWVVAGDLTMNGVTRQAVFTMQGSPEHPFGDRAFRAVTLMGTVDWRQWGMRYQDGPAHRANPEYGHGFEFTVALELTRKR